MPSHKQEPPRPSGRTAAASPGASNDRGRTSRGFGIVAFIVGLFGAASWFQPDVAASDLWWHLASGREIWRLHAIPAVDSFSHTFAGRPWTNHEWLWDLIYWTAYRVAPDAAAWLNYSVLLAIFAVLFIVLVKSSGSPLASAATLWIAAATAHWFLDIRPHLFSLLFVSVVLATRDRRWGPWLWPPLMIVWANVHAGFVFGIGLVGLLAVIRTAEWALARASTARPMREWGIFTACCAASILNPYGIGIIGYPLAYMDRSSPFRSLIEWTPPGLSLDPSTFQGRFACMAVLAVLGTVAVLVGARSVPRPTTPGSPTGARPLLFNAALAVVTLIMAMSARRFIPLFAVTSAPLAAIALATGGRWAIARFPSPARGGLRWGALAVGGAAAILLWRDVRLSPSLLYRWTEGFIYPSAAVRYLAVLDPARNLFNHYNYGGYIILSAPGRKVFIDSRANTLYDDAIFRDYAEIYQARPGFGSLLERYRIDSAILDLGAPLRRALLSAPRPWVQVYSDRLAAILLSPEAFREGGIPDPRTVLSDDPEESFTAAQAALAAGDFRAASTLAEETLDRNPLLPSAYGLLAFIRGKQGDGAGLREAIRKGIRAEPRWESQFRILEGAAWEQMGNLPNAAEAYRRSDGRGPFQTPGAALSRIRRLGSASPRPDP
jgi:hypothetical protein